MDCRGNGTPFLRGIPLASRRGNASLSRGMLRISRRHTLALWLKNLYDRSRVTVRPLGRHSPI